MNPHLLYFVDVLSNILAVNLFLAVTFLFMGTMLKLLNVGEDDRGVRRTENIILFAGFINLAAYVFIPRSEVLLKLLGG